MLVQAVSSTYGFILVRKVYDWLDALNYCTSRYQGLAAITAAENITTINRMMESHPTNAVWIGLHDDVDGWKWSLPDKGVNASEEEPYRNWQPGQPDNNGSDQRCVSMMADGLWRDNSCALVNLSFVCFSTEGETDTYTLVDEGLSWVEARGYCGQHYMDLASVRSLADSQDIQQMMQDPLVPEVWIGLYRDSWTWSGGINSSFSSWSAGQPDNAVDPQACVSMLNGKWNDTSCDTQLYFLCQGQSPESPVPAVKKDQTENPTSTTSPDQPVVQRRTTTVKMKLRSNRDLEDATVADELRQQFAAALEMQGVTDVQLTWRALRKEPQPTWRDTCGEIIK
ncbi:C-type mannose receptor 2-like [Spinachia spinachia]